MSRPIPSPFPRTKVITGPRLEKGMDIARRTHAWMEANEEAFWAIYEQVKRMQAGGVKGRIRDRVAARCVDLNVRVGADYAFNNDYWAGISRYLVLYDPSLKDDPVRGRESAVDCYGLLPVSWLPATGGEND